MLRSLSLVALALCACNAGSAPSTDLRSLDRAPARAEASSSRGGYKVVPLVSDGYTSTPRTDPNLVNAWGLVAGPTTPWWVANNGTATSTLYDGAGVPLALIVSLPGTNGPAAPTGLVFNAGTGY